jgi:hypothetical protein
MTVISDLSNSSDLRFKLTGSARGEVYAHCLFVIRNIAFIPHGVSIIPSSSVSLAHAAQAKRTFLLRTNPRRWCFGGSVVPIPMVCHRF